MDAKIFLSPHFSMEDKRVAIELWKAEWFPLKNIRKHLHMSESSLRHVLIHAKSQGEDIDYLKSLVESMPRRLEAVLRNSRITNKYF